jgi:hypothetical protein
MSPGDFAVAVVSYCLAVDASETSGFRTPTHNVNVGGVPTSPHLVGLGRDVVYDERPALGEAERIAASFGLRVVREGDHDHLQPLSWT